MLTVVVAGGGFAGAETAGAVNDLLREAIHFYPNLREHMLRIVLVHPGEVILPELSESLGRYAEKQLKKRGVEIRLKTGVAGYDGKELTLSEGTKYRYPFSRLDSRHLSVAAGIRPAVRQEAGRGAVNACLQIPQWPGVWALGDCVAVPDSLNPGKVLSTHRATRYPSGRRPGVQYRGRNARPGAPAIPIQDPRHARRHRTSCGRGGDSRREVFGFIAWVLWRTIYLSKLPGLQKKVRVALDWDSRSGLLKGHRSASHLTLGHHVRAGRAALRRYAEARIGNAGT